MRTLLYTLLLAGVPFLAACDQTVDQAAEDVREAEQNAAESINAQQQEVQDAAKEGQEAVIQEQRELEDTARQEAENIREEERDLQDAQRDALNDPNAPVTPAPVPGPNP